MNLGLWQTRFRDYLEARNYSERTIEGYVAGLRPFFEFLACMGIDSLGGVTRDVVAEYSTSLYAREYRGRRIAASTQAMCLCRLRVFFRFLEREGFVPMDPTGGLELPRVAPRTLPTMLSEQEAVRVLEAAPGTTPIDVRNRTMLEVLYCTAIRNSELRSLTLDDVDLEAAELVVRCGKRRKARRLPLGEEAVAWLRDYTDHARPHFVTAPAERLLFLSLRGGPLRRNTLSTIVRDIAKRAGLGKRVTPHVLRHCCASHMLRRGAGLRQLQELMGHESPHTTQRYTRLDVSDLRKVLERCHPREKKA